MEYSESIEGYFLSPSFRLPRVRKRRGETWYSFVRNILERNYVWQPHHLFMALQERITASPVQTLRLALTQMNLDMYFYDEISCSIELV